MSQAALINPVNIDELKEAKLLSKAEERFVECMALSGECTISDHRPESPASDRSNVVRADLIRFFAWGGDNEHQIKGNTIVLCGAYVEDVLNLTHIPSPHALMLLNCHFSEQVAMSYARFRSLDMGGSLLAHTLIGSGMKVDNNLCMNTGFVAESGVNLLGANVGGDLYCDGGIFKSNTAPGNKGQAITADRIKIGGNAFLRFGFKAEGEVRFLGANIGSNLYCTGEIYGNEEPPTGNEEPPTFNADSIKVGGNISLNGGFTTDGEVRMDSANIGGTLDCIKGKFLNQKGRALTATSVVAGKVFLRDGFVAENAVWLLGANIIGDLDCNGGNFKSKDDYALVADNARVGGNFRMGAYDNKACFCANGGVKLIFAKIAGKLDCCGGKFINSGKIAFSADGVKAGVVCMNSSDKGVHFFANGDVRLVAAKVDINWECTGGHFGGNVFAESAQIGNSIFWREVVGGNTAKVCGRGTIGLQGATADIFDYDEQSRDGFNFILDGFSYRQFAKKQDVQSRIKWLDNCPAFSPQPFEHAAKVLFAMGRDNDAREILLAKEERLTKRGNMSGALRFCRKLWDWFAGYGYRLRKTLAWAAMFVVWGMVIFKYADHSCRIFPHQPLVTVQGKYAKEKVQHCAVERLPTRVVEENFPEYPEFNALAYSLDVFIPFFALHQESHWYPQVQKGDGFLMFYFLRFWFWLEVAAGWLLTSLAVLSITGLLRPRQSSGDKE